MKDFSTTEGCSKKWYEAKRVLQREGHENRAKRIKSEIFCRESTSRLNEFFICVAFDLFSCLITFKSYGLWCSSGNFISCCFFLCIEHCLFKFLSSSNSFMSCVNNMSKFRKSSTLKFITMKKSSHFRNKLVNFISSLFIII